MQVLQFSFCCACTMFLGDAFITVAVASASKKSIGFQSLIILARALGNKKFEAETRFCKFQGCFNVKFWTSKSNATQHKRQFRFSIKVLTIKCMKENSTKSPLMSWKRLVSNQLIHFQFFSKKCLEQKQLFLSSSQTSQNVNLDSQKNERKSA